LGTKIGLCVALGLAKINAQRLKIGLAGKNLD
jgi:hypothetical protein